MKNTASPTRAKPLEPERAYKFVSYTGKLLNNAFNGARRVRDSRRNKYCEALPIGLFFNKMQESLNNLNINLDHVVAERLSEYSFAIGHRVFVESEEDYLKRYEKYEADLREYEMWASLPERDRVAIERSSKKLAKLQRERDNLKVKLAAISVKIDEVVNHTA